MQCMVCATELLHAANFCPVCGARLAAPPPDGSAATTPGNETPDVVVDTPVGAPQPNVVYLPGTDAGSAPVSQPPAGGVEANPHATTYAQTQHGVPEPYTPVTELSQTPANPPVQAQQPAPDVQHPSATVGDLPAMHPVVAAEPAGGYAAQLAATLQGDLGTGPIQAVPPSIVTAGSHGVVPPPQQLQPPQPIRTNPFGDFFSDGPSAWLEDEDEDSLDAVVHGSRLLGTLVAAAAILLLIAAWAYWGYGMYRDAGGAESAPILLVAMILWIRYLTLPRDQQHRALLVRQRAISDFVERTARPIRRRTEGTMAVRSERDRYRAMRDERQRRINALGEAAHRTFRNGQLPAELHAPAQRVLAIERQMLVQDSRIHELVVTREQRVDDPASDRTDAASDAPEGGQQPR
jgi:hypothetical protein